MSQIWALPFLASAALCAGAENIEMLAWRQPVVGQVHSGGVYRIEIPPEVFDGCRAFPADLRIVDENGSVCPFFLWSPPRRDEIIPVFTTMGRRAGGAGGEAVVQEVTIRATPRDPAPRHNEISILTVDQDFVRRVEILGSDDGKSWRELGSGYVVDRIRESHVSNRIVTYPESNLQHLLVRIHPNAGREKDPIDVSDVQVAYHIRSADPLREVKLEPLPLPATEFRDGVQTLGFDTGAQNRMIEQLRVRVGGSGDFVLPAKIFGRNSAETPWRWVGDGGLYRINGQGRGTIDLRNAAYRQLKIEFYHQDEKMPPVSAVVAGATPQFIVFEAKGGSSPLLHYGAARMPLPHYDLQRRTSESAITNAPLLQLGRARSNPLKVASGLSAYLRTMTWAAAAIIASIVLVVISRAMRARL
jgi:hypothetical protein